MVNEKGPRKTLLLSYPRSGNTLMRYFLEYVTAQPTQGYIGSGGDGNPVAASRRYIVIDHALPKIYKRHAATEDVKKEFDTAEDRLILLLRHPLECFIRHFGVNIIMDWAGNTLERNCGIGHPDHYFKNIEFYDKWEGEKHIFYYEDQIEHPTTYWESVNNFVGGDSKKLDAFIANLVWHLNQSRSHYGDSKTSGQQALSHSLRLNEEQRAKISEMVLTKAKEVREATFLEKYNIVGGA